MEKHLKNSVSGPKLPFSPTSSKEKNPWRLPSGTDVYHASSDVSLFSTSLPVIRHETFKFSESEQNVLPNDDGFPSLSKVRMEDEDKDPLEDVEPSAIGSGLPGDEDELFTGLMDDFDLSGLPTQLEDLDDDFFESGGGLEIESEIHDSLVNGITRLSTSDVTSGTSAAHYGLANGVGTVSGEHPYGEHPSRTLFVRNINSNVEDSELKSLFENFGDIRTLYTACKHRGFVMISYYDIRAARTAMRSLQNKPLRRRKLDIHFSIPKDNPSEKDVNQGTLVVFNLDASVSNDDLRQIFGAYGEIKEIRETPHKRHHKFIEFYDVRDADAALKALNRIDIAGKRIKLEPSRPGGARRSFLIRITSLSAPSNRPNDGSGTTSPGCNGSLIQQLSLEPDQDEALGFLHHVGSPIANSPPGSWQNFGSPIEHNSFHAYSPTMSNLGSLSPGGSNHLPGLASILPSHDSNSAKIAPIGKDPRKANQVITKSNTAHGAAYQHSYSVYDPKLSSSCDLVSPFGDSKLSSDGTLSGPQFLWGSPTITSENLNSSPWSSLSLKGRPFPSSKQGIGFPYTSPHGSFVGSGHHVGSAPSGIQLDKHFGIFPESTEPSYINQAAAFGVKNYGLNHGIHSVHLGSPGAVSRGISFAGNFTESGSAGSRMISPSGNGPLYFENGSFGGMGTIINDGLFDRARNRRAESGGQMDNRRQYQLDLEKIMNGEDSRTTLMIKNIPNKYTSKMLLAAIDETHKGTYDFLYLPIDFKNKCNVGYAFINMVSPSHIVTFYKVFNGKKWEKFNSEKVASLAYARIQGKAGLVSHFQNSSLMNEDKRCRPIIFQLEGQETGYLESFPSGNLNVFIRQPDGSYAGDSLDSPKDDSDEKL